MTRLTTNDTARRTGALLLLAAAVLGLHGCAAKQAPVAEQDLEQARQFQVQYGAAKAVPADLTQTTAWAADSGWKTRAPEEIAPGFKLAIDNPDDSALRGQFRVKPDGTIKLPYEVELKADGLTPPQLEERLNEAYARFLTRPKFRVTIEKKEVYVSVRGLVEKPGAYLFDTDSSLDELIAKAGGLQRNDDKDRKARYARVTQDSVSKMINLQDYFSGTPGLLPHWQGGEMVFFQNEGPASLSNDRQYIQILGQVSAPGAYPFRPNSDFVSYLTLAGGPTDRADLKRITLLRRDGSGLHQDDFELSDVGPSGPGIQPGDTVIVNADAATQVERKSGVAAALAAIVSAVALVAAL